jgi:hypothetical protein
VKHFRQRQIVSYVDAGSENMVETVYEYWYAPELKANLTSKRVDPRTGIQTTSLKNIHRGAPSAALFEIPEGFKVIVEEKAARSSP